MVHSGEPDVGDLGLPTRNAMDVLGRMRKKVHSGIGFILIRPDYLPIAPKPRRAKPGIAPTEADEEDEMAAAEEDEDETSVATPAMDLDPESEAGDAAPAQKAKFDPATSPGIHLGYHLLPGGMPNATTR